MLLAEEIAEEYEVNGKEILTPRGWRKIKTVYKTIPLEVWELSTETRTLECSAHHLVKTYAGWKHVYAIRKDDLVVTENGYEHVLKCRYTGRKEALYDITVDDPSGEFYSNGVASHNSTTFCTRQLLLSQLIPRYSGIYVAPSHPMLETYASRFQDMEGFCRIDSSKQNKYSKRYKKNGSKLDFAYCLESEKNVRGKTCDELMADEIQNLNPDLLPAILYTQTSSALPMTVYAGTALSTDTLLENKWRLSSMGMWHVRAGDGKHWLNMYDRETLYKVCNHPTGPKCPYTNKPLDVTNGCYVHANKQAFDAGNVGIHVPQCIIKDFAEDPVQWGKIYRHIVEDDFKKVLQECFGIAVAEGAREITQQDLQNICVLKVTDKEILDRCERGYYRMIISGCDWGGSDYSQTYKTQKSFTVHCVIGLAPDGVVDILHYRQYAGMNYMEISQLIMHDHRRFRAKAMASDFGAGMAYNNELRQYMPFDRHFIMEYKGPQCAALATPKGVHYQNQLQVNRTEALTNVFKDLKTFKIRAREWEHSGKYLLDWLNIFRVPTETQSGKKTFLYRRNAQKSDDALHAFNFAYVLMKYYKGESLVEDPAVTRAIDAVLRAQTPMQQAMVSRMQARIAGNTQWVISG